jgi:uncharacterized protein YgiM (DUF1202 family)
MALLSSKRTLLIVGVLVAVLVLYILGSAKRKDAAQPAADTNQCRVTVTADVLRVHAGPELASKVVDRLTKGQETNADKLVQNGFRKIGDNRWVAVDFAQPLAGRDCG